LPPYLSALTNIDHLRTQNAELQQENLTLKEELASDGGRLQLNDDWRK